MALYKEIVNNLGVTTKYHIIRGITRNLKDITVTVDSYADKKYRDLEKEAVSDTEFGNIVDELNNVYIKYAPKTLSDAQALIGPIDYDTIMSDDDKKTIAELKNKIDNFHRLSSTASGSYVINTTVINLSTNASDISLENIYEKLKTIEPFTDASDC